MKKLISLLLVIIITCSVLSGCVYFDRYLKIKKVYLDQFGIKDKNPEDVIIDYDGGTYNGARIVMLDAEWHDPEEWTEIIGETKLQYYDSNRLYAYKDGHFITLTQAFENSILKKSDVQEIARDFNDKVTHYRDTCDKYDFAEGKIVKVPEDDKEHISYKSIRVYFDYRVTGTGIGESNVVDATTLMEYLGCDMITNIGVLYGFFNHPEFPDYSAKLAIVSLKYQTKTCAEYVMKKIVKIPGVIGTCFNYPLNIFAETTNGSYSSGEYNWINDIEVEKVWDFTTGS